MLYSQILRTDIIKQLFTPQRTTDGNVIKYGLGWELLDDQKSPHYVVSHSGMHLQQLI
jgi:hypothetical protein